MNSSDKRGISAIVATVLIILITVAAVTILWSAIVPMVTDKIDDSTACLDAVNAMTVVDEGYTCKTTSELRIQVRRGADSLDIRDIQVIAIAGGDSQSLNLVASGVADLNDLPSSNEAKTFIIPGVNFGAMKVADIDAVRVAPIIKVRNTEKSCDALSVTKVLVCV